MTASTSLKLSILACAVMLALVADMFPGCGSPRRNPANSPENKPANAASSQHSMPDHRNW